MVEDRLMANFFESSEAGLDQVECSELLRRICESEELKRSHRLRDFLSFVGQRTLHPESGPISEYEIGIRVFDRREGYDTSTDNIVRVNASELRKRIAAYYAGEGAGESILLDIPLRSYTPQFHRRPASARPAAAPTADVEPQISTELAIPAAAAIPATARGMITRNAGYFLSVLLAVACIYLLYARHSMRNQLYAWRSEPTLSSFWGGLLDTPRQVDVVLADSSFSQVEDSLKTHIPLNDYLNRNYIAQIQASNLPPETKDSLHIIAARNNASLGDFRVAQKIFAFDPLSKLIQLRYARDYQPSDIRKNTVILIGSSHSNPWCSLFEDRLNFVLAYDPDLNQMSVKNRHPEQGEVPVYQSRIDPNNAQGYSVIDYIPNNDRTANVLIIAGTTSEATEAAGDFLTSEEQFHRFQEQLHTARIPYFELLLKTTKLVGTPLSAQIIAYRTFPDHQVGAR
jgi:hypothetical protein